jgi:hypothetical protein
VEVAWFRSSGISGSKLAEGERGAGAADSALSTKQACRRQTLRQRSARARKGSITGQSRALRWPVRSRGHGTDRQPEYSRALQHRKLNFKQTLNFEHNSKIL